MNKIFNTICNILAIKLQQMELDLKYKKQLIENTSYKKAFKELVKIRNEEIEFYLKQIKKLQENNA